MKGAIIVCLNIKLCSSSDPYSVIQRGNACSLAADIGLHFHSASSRSVILDNNRVKKIKWAAVCNVISSVRHTINTSSHQLYYVYCQYSDSYCYYYCHFGYHSGLRWLRASSSRSPALLNFHMKSQLWSAQRFYWLLYSLDRWCVTKGSMPTTNALYGKKYLASTMLLKAKEGESNIVSEF